jgi:thiol-disulfide isomerase/thioredoxin
MKRSGLTGFGLTIALTSCALLLTACSSSSSAPENIEAITSFAPCTEIERVADRSGGATLQCLDSDQEISLTEIKGPAVITVWASWCSNCEAQRPNFIKLYQESDRRFQVIGVDVEERRKSDGLNHAINSGMSYPHLYDPDGRSLSTFGPGVPVTQFIGEDGTLIFQKIGPIFQYQELRELVEEYLGIKV